MHFVIRSPLPLRRTSGSRPRHGPRAARRPISYIYVYIYSDPYVRPSEPRVARAGSSALYTETTLYIQYSIYMYYISHICYLKLMSIHPDEET